MSQKAKDYYVRVAVSPLTPKIRRTLAQATREAIRLNVIMESPVQILRILPEDEWAPMTLGEMAAIRLQAVIERDQQYGTSAKRWKLRNARIKGLLIEAFNKLISD